MLAISERVVIRADDLLNWCDDTINWTYGLRANTLLNPTIKTESSETNDNHSEATTATATMATTQHDSDPCIDNASTNVRSLKNSKLDFTEVENEKGKNKIHYDTHFIPFAILFTLQNVMRLR